MYVPEYVPPKAKEMGKGEDMRGSISMLVDKGRYWQVVTSLRNAGIPYLRAELQDGADSLLFVSRAHEASVDDAVSGALRHDSRRWAELR